MGKHRKTSTGMGVLASWR